MKESPSLLMSRRYLALSHGARSAFDLSGFGALRGPMFGTPLWQSVDPAGAIAQDMGRVMKHFGRSASCGRRALDDGLEIEQLASGCTAFAAPQEARKLPTRQAAFTNGVASSGTARR